MEEKYSCKICFTSSDLEEDPLISPCKCNSKVHKSCIEMWRRKKIGKNQYYRCEVCLEKYKISIFLKTQRVILLTKLTRRYYSYSDNSLYDLYWKK